MSKFHLFIGYIVLTIALQFLIADTRLVPEDYPTIQSAIDVFADEGDTILVSQGTYVENIDYTGKNIYLTSDYFITEHDSSIHNTIIDGNQNGSVVTFYGSETRDAVLNGFTITNGSGRYFSGSFSHGGGLYIRDSSPSILNCLIKNNSIYGFGFGGGMMVKNSSALLSNLTVTENYSESFGAGGIFFSNSDAEMDSINRCSVFLNEAADHNDIRCNSEFELCPLVYLDTASVNIIDDYFIKDIDVVDINIGKLEKVANDLYVSPDGDNNNSGLTADEPLRNITYALHVIDADSLNPRIIHLLPGTYSPSGGQHFPLNLRSYVSLIGSGKENTILDLEQVKSYAMMGANYEKDITLSSMTIKNGFSDIDVEHTAMTLKFYQNSSLVIDNMVFSDITSRSILNPTMITSYMEWQDYTSTIIRNCEFRNNTVLTAASLGWNTDILVQNCKFESNLPVESAEDDWIDGSHLSIFMGGHNYTYEFPYTRRVENCVIANNVNIHSGEIGVKAVSLSTGSLFYPLNIVNCTFSDNTSQLCSIWIESDQFNHTEVRFVNCILWNDDLPYEIFVPEDYYEGEIVHLIMAYNDVQNGYDDFLFEGAVDLIYEDTNIDTEPLFVDPENGDYTLQPNSPLIDAGTALYIVNGDTVVNLSPDQYYGDAPDMGAYEWVDSLTVHNQILPESISITTYPNPFNPNTNISFSLERKSKVSLVVHDILGRHIITLLDGLVLPGKYNIEWNGRDEFENSVASGTYIAQLFADDNTSTKKITIVR